MLSAFLLYVFFAIPIILNISSSKIPLTFGKDTIKHVALSACLFLIAELRPFAEVGFLWSSR
jgi:hypothetical protein